MGNMLRAMLRAVPGIFWVGALWTVLALLSEDVRGIYIAAFCVVVGAIQLGRGPGSGFAGTAGGSGSADAKGLTFGEVLFAVLIGIAAVGGAVYGWVAASTIWAVLGGAVMFGILGLLLASVFALAGAGFAQVLDRRNRL